jgi:flavin-dependent dehydrogenase
MAGHLAFDVAIVGAGPAGCAAAIWAAACGLRTVLLEARAFPRERPGETLHPGVEPLFRQLGVDEKILSANFYRHSGQWVAWNGKPEFQEFGKSQSGPWLGFQVPGAVVDAILLRRAEALGVTVLQPRRAVAPLLSEGRVVGVRTDSAEVRARYTIDGSGRRHWLPSQAGLLTVRHSPRLIATYGYSRGECRLPGNCPMLTATRQGWTWVAPIRPDLYAWTRLDFSGELKRAPEQLAGLEACGPFRGADVTWRIVNECAGPGYFLCGDAASVIDPAASHGVLRALMSGILAADLILRISDGRTAESQAIRTFQHWTCAWHAKDVQRLAALYAALSPRSLGDWGAGQSVTAQPFSTPGIRADFRRVGVRSAED